MDFTFSFSFVIARISKGNPKQSRIFALKRVIASLPLAMTEGQARDCFVASLLAMTKEHPARLRLAPLYRRKF
ncbi:MAG: hypothetical protein ACPLPS_04155 [bacterium]